MKRYKILFADLDGTLIKTKSGETFPKGIWDMEFRFDVLDAIKKMKPLALFIVSNQGGVESGFVDRRNFEFKMEYIIRSIREYTGLLVEYSCCYSNDKSDQYRKPNIGMLVSFFSRVQTNWFRHDGITKEDHLMIGDASGKEWQFSNSDKKAAENFGIDYMDVDDFVEQLKNDQIMTREEIRDASKDYVNYLLDKQEYHNEDYTEYDIQQAFEKGAQWADENPQSPWIDVKEKLPYNNSNFIHFGFTNRVLVRNKNRDLFVAYMKKNKDNKWIWCNDIDDNFDLLSCVTHWMPIPKLPKE